MLNISLGFPLPRQNANPSVSIYVANLKRFRLQNEFQTGDENRAFAEFVSNFQLTHNL